MNVSNLLYRSACCNFQRNYFQNFLPGSTWGPGSDLLASEVCDKIVKIKNLKTFVVGVIFENVSQKTRGKKISTSHRSMSVGRSMTRRWSETTQSLLKFWKWSWFRWPSFQIRRANGRWRLVSAQVVSYCVHDIPKQ